MLNHLIKRAKPARQVRGNFVWQAGERRRGGETGRGQRRGFMLSDKKAGAFTMEVEWIKVERAETAVKQ